MSPQPIKSKLYIQQNQITHMQLNFLLMLAIILIVARICEEIAARLNQTSIVGNLMAGILLGPMFLNILAPNEILEFFGLLGVMFLMVLAGLEVNLKDLKSITGTAIMVTIFSTIIPLTTGIIIGLLFSMNIFESIIIGVAISITASAVTVEILEATGQIRKKIGETLITAGILNEIISLFMITAMISALKYTSVLQSLGAYELHFMRLITFFLISIIFGYYIVPEIMKHTKKMKSIESSFAISIILIITFAGVAEYFSLHALIGAFIAGLSLNHYMIKNRKKEIFEEDIRSFSEGFMTPVFFVLIGASISLTGLLIHPLFTLTLILVAIISKFIGSFIGAISAGIHDIKESTSIGTGMVIRGSVTLVVAHIIKNIALESPEILPHADLIISSLILMVLVINVIIPSTFRKTLEMVNK